MDGILRPATATSPEAGRSISADVRSRVLAGHDQFFRPEDFSGSTKAVNRALTRLVAEGELRRERRGLYWRGGSATLEAPADRLAAAQEIVGTAGVGPAGKSALAILGLREAPSGSSLELAVPQRPPRPLAGVHFINRSSCRSRLRMNLNTWEVAFLEALEESVWLEAKLSSVELVSCLERLAGREVDIGRLTGGAATEAAGVRERLRLCLRQAGFDREALRISRPRSLEAQARALAVWEGRPIVIEESSTSATAG